MKFFMKKLAALILVFLFINPRCGFSQKFGLNIDDSMWVTTFLPKMLSLESEEFTTNYAYYNKKADSIISQIAQEVHDSDFKYEEYDEETGESLIIDYHNYLEYVERRLTCCGCFEQPLGVQFKYLHNSQSTKGVYEQLQLMRKYVDEDMYIHNEPVYSKFYQLIQDSMDVLNPTDKIGAYLSFYEIVIEQNGPPLKRDLPIEFYYLRPHKQFVLTEYYGFLMETAGSITDIENKIDAYIKISDFYFNHDLSLKALRVLFEASTFIDLQKEENLFLRERIMLKLYEILQSSKRYDKIATAIVFNELIRTGLPQKFVTPGAVTEENLTDNNYSTIFNVANIVLSEDWGDSSDQISAVPLSMKYFTIYIYRGDSLGEASKEIMDLFFAMGRENAKKFPFEKSIFYENRLFQRAINPEEDLNKALQEYCFIQILKNNWSKATSVLNKYSHEYKNINSLSFLLGVLNNRVSDPLFIKDKKGFFEFMDTVYSIGINNHIKKSNENVYMANYYFLLHQYYKNIRPFSSNLSDSIRKYGYLGYINHPMYQENVPDLLAQIYWRGDSVLSLQNISDSLTKLNILLARKKDSLDKEYIIVQSEYNKQISDNKLLRSENTRFTSLNRILGDNNQLLGKRNLTLNRNLDTMAKDTIRLGLQIITMDSSITKLKTDTASLNRAINTKNETIDDLNDKIINRTKVGGALLALFAGAFIFLGIQLKKLNSKKQKLSIEVANMNSQIESARIAYEQELNSSNSKILNEYAVKHEIVGINSSLHSFMEINMVKIDPFILRQVQFVSSLKEILFNLKSFTQLYYETLHGSTFNTLSQEIKLSNAYVEFIKFKSLSKAVVFRSNIEEEEGELLVPNHIVNNFVKNSIEKGIGNNNNLEISIEGQKTSNGYQLRIIDNGVGISDDFKIEELPKKSTGIRNIMKQIEHYNLQKDLRYRLEFGNESFQNRKFYDSNNGTVVTLKFYLK